MSYESQRNATIHQLYEDYYEYLVIRCRRHIGRKNQELQTQVEDVVQEAFMKAIIEYEDFKSHRNQVGWLVKACYNLLGNREHVQYTRAKFHAFSLDAEKSPELRDEADEINRLLEKDANNRLIQRIHNALSEKEQAIFTAYFQEELSLQQTAKATNRTISSVKGLLHRIRIRARGIAKKEF